MGTAVSDDEFYDKHVKGRSGMTQALYCIIQMKTSYMIEEYEMANEMVFKKK